MMRRPRPDDGARPGGVGGVDEEDDGATPTTARLSPQPSSAELSALACQIGRERQIHLERAAAARAAYGALSRADELAPSPALRSAALIALGALADARGDLARLDALAWFAGLEGER